MERSSATTRICGAPPSAWACAWVSAVIVRTTSAAEAFCRRDHLDVRVARLVDALDDAQHAVHVVGAVRDDQDVRGRVGGQVAVLRDQRPQDRHQLRRADVLHRDRPG